jgi:putative ABC transport system substrate-binding protein
MKRREFIGAIGGVATGTSAMVPPAQAEDRVWRLGALSIADDGMVRQLVLPALAKAGFVEGRNLIVDLRIAPAEKMPEVARALVGDKPDLIVAVGDWALHPARAATATIPIVVAPIGIDPVAAGVAQSWAHPGGNVTGVCLLAMEIEVKRLSLLHEAVPEARRIAVLCNHPDLVEPLLPPVRDASGKLGLELVEVWFEDAIGYPRAFDAVRAAGAEALEIVPTPETYRDAAQLAALSLKARLPTMSGYGAHEGLMIAFGPDILELGRQAANYVVRILNGARVGDLPFEGPTHIGFAVNMKTARALGLTIPPAFLAGADEVIE